MRNQILLGDSAEVLQTLPADSIGAVVTDPPYGLGTRQPTGEEIQSYLRGEDLDMGGDFMSKKWSFPSVALWREVYRVLEPGGVLMAFAGSRTLDLMAAGIEAAGFQYNCTLGWTYGCLSEDTELLTEQGWEPYHRIMAGTLAMCYDTDRDTFQWQPIQQVYIYRYHDTAYALRGDHTDQIVSRNHRCLVERGGATVYEYAEDLQSEEVVPVVEDMPGLLQALPVSIKTGLEEKTALQSNLYHREPTSYPGCQRSTCRATSRNGAGHLHRVSDSCVASPCLAPENGSTYLLPEVQRSTSRGGLGETRAQGASGLDGDQCGFVSREDDGAAQSCLERRGDVLLEARELRVGPVRSVPTGVPSDGPQGRVRGGTPAYRGASDGSLSLAAGSRASCQSQPHGQSSGEPASLRLEPGSQAVRASRFTRTDLVRVEAIEYDGIVWCVRVPTGAFVARRAGKAFITGNSGFPKSLNIGKAISKMRGVDPVKEQEIATYLRGQREALGLTRAQVDAAVFGGTTRYTFVEGRNNEKGDFCIYLPTPEEWVRVKDVLKLDDRFDAYIQAAIPSRAERALVDGGKAELVGTEEGSFGYQQSGARWEKTQRVTKPATDDAKRWDGWGTALKPSWEPVLVFSKGPTEWQAPRVPFLYMAKAARSERHQGLDKLPERPMHALSDQPRSTQSNRRCQTCELLAFGQPHCECEEPDWGETDGSRSKNHHPSVKPVEVMRWLVRLASGGPTYDPGAPVLDPFLGSGTTAVACAEEGVVCIGIERDPEYHLIAEHRHGHAQELADGRLSQRVLFDLAMMDDE